MKQGIFPVITGLAAAICWCGIAQAQPAQEPHSPVTIRGEVLQPQSPVTILRGVQTPRPGASSAKTLTANDYLNLTFFLGQEDQALGLTLTEANDELREQLKLPREQGVVVSSLAGGGPADLAGLKLHDILLFLDEKPIRKPDELSKLLKAAGEKEVPLELMRAGKMQTIQVKPVYRVTLAPTAPENPRNYIGLSGGTLDETLRSHLKIPSDLGFPVTSVIEDGPAAKAGIKTGDIILAFNTQPVESVQQLSELVQAYDAGSGPAEIEVQRGGETRTFAITPEPWKQRPETDWVEAEAQKELGKTFVLGIVPGTGELRQSRVRETPGGQNFRYWVDSMDPGRNFRGADGNFRMAMPISTPDPALKQQLDSLQSQVKDLKALLEKLGKELEQTRKQ